MDRLAEFRRMFCRKAEVSGRSYWSKNVVMLWRCVKDNVCYAIHIEDIIKHWDELEEASPEMMKDNHGKDAAEKSGRLIPVHLLEKFS